jgi:hypothetical protein
MTTDMSQFPRISLVCVAEGSESSSDSEGDAEEKAENERCVTACFFVFVGDRAACGWVVRALYFMLNRQLLLQRHLLWRVALRWLEFDCICFAIHDRVDTLSVL